MADAPGRLVYGTILVATLLAAESAVRETYGETAAAVAVAVAVYWLVNGYATFTGRRAEHGEHFTLRGYGEGLVAEAPLLVGALGPLIVVLACWAAGARLDTATRLGVWVAAAIIVVTEVALGLRSHLDGRELVVQTAFGVLFGVGLVAIRVLLH